MHEEQPFGPIDANELLDNSGHLKLLFTVNDDLTKDLLSRRRNLIIGRKGTGKTTLKLKMLTLAKNFQFTSELNIALEYHRISKIISSLAEQNPTVESASSLWGDIVWAWFFLQIVQRKRSLDFSDNTVSSCSEFLLKLGIHTPAPTGDDIFSHLVSYLALNNNHREYLRSFIKLERSSIFSILRKRNYKCCIVIDTLEFYRVLESDYKNCLMGLMHCCSWLQTQSEFVDCYLFFPDELTQRFKSSISKSVLKDFRDAIHIRWTGSELVQLAALRFDRYLSDRQTHPGTVPDRYYYKTPNAVFLLNSVLPPTVFDGSGKEIETITYILRHTQLTPRQFIWILNAICVDAVRSKDVRNGILHQVSDDHVCNTVRASAAEVCEDVLATYREVYPTAEAVLSNVLRKLPPTFDADILQIIHRDHGIKSEYGMSLEEFYNMLSDLGVVGLITDEIDLPPNHTGLNAKFSYTETSRVALFASGTFCMHPMFSLVYNPEISKKFIVNPLGSDARNTKTR